MILIESAIRELLFDHDCVIIPGLGGVLGNYVGAEIHPVTNALRPPRKKIAFNESLQLNDCLLQNAVAVGNDITTEQALSEIHEFVKAFNDKIREYGLYRIEGVGDFVRNEENKIEFQPIDEVNFLDKSFGLTELYYKPVQRDLDDEMKQLDNESNPVRKAPAKKKRPSEKKVTDSGVKKNRNSFLYFVIPGLLLLAGGGGYMYFGVSQEGIQEASLMSATTEVLEVEEEELMEETIEDSSFEEIEELEEVIEAVQYYIVAGVFSSEDNAIRFKELNNQGNILNDGEYYRVYLDKFDSKEEASSHLVDYKAGFGDKLWLLEY